ncbi:hypothetical protein MMC19_006869 [Ptychographa xylographoides]|nr:hypothetical protein [Ptychographa xylographoides]
MFFLASLLPLLAGSYFLACLPSAGGSQFVDRDDTYLLAAISGADKVLRRADAPPPAQGAQPVQPQAPAHPALPAAQAQAGAPPQAPAQAAHPAAQAQAGAPPQAPAQPALPAAQAQAGAPLQAPAQQVLPAVQPQAGLIPQAPAQPGIAPIIMLPAAQFAGPEDEYENDLEGPSCIQCLLTNLGDCTNCVSYTCVACIVTAACGWFQPSTTMQQCSNIGDDCQMCIGNCLGSCRRPRVEPLPPWWKA